MVMPVYLAEITPKESRGMLGSVIGPMYSLGLNIGLCTNIGYARFGIGWRMPTAVIAAVGLVFTIGMMFMPHTPR